MPNQRNNFKVIKNKDGHIDVTESLFQAREVFLHGEICAGLVDSIICDLRVLDKIDNKPITMYINSPGGSVQWGLALIDTISTLKSKVIFVGSGILASMAAVIFTTGKDRRCTKNTTFMFHDMYSGVVDYSEKMEARVDFQKKEWKALRDLIKNNSKLTEQELDYMRHGELWLFAAEAKAKGIVDTII